jgi:hypothetical protein
VALKRLQVTALLPKNHQSLTELLHTSTKTGRLIVNGDRGSASLWIVEGDLVGGSTSADPHGPDLIDVVFDVLRDGHGSFIFENDAACPTPVTPMPIVPALSMTSRH